MSLIFNGIILRVTPYKERAEILLLFTTELGLVSAIVRESKKTPTRWVEPFVVVRGKFKERKGNFFQIEELDGTHWYLGLREKPSALRMLNSIVKSTAKKVEMESPAPLLYKLFLKIVEALEKGSDPETMEGLFLVKLALHEGILSDLGEPWIAQAAQARSFSEVPIIPKNLVFALNRLFC